MSYPLSATEILTLIGIVIFYLFLIIPASEYDTLQHFHFASQISRGKFPPSSYGFTDIPAKYHYGWAIMLSSLSRIANINYIKSSDILTIYCLIGNILLFMSLIKRLGCSQKYIIVGSILFFLGGGIFIVPAKLFFGNLRNGACIPSIFRQSPWLFGVGIFLYLLNFLAISQDTKKITLIRFLVLMIPFTVLPVANGTSSPVFILTILIFAFLVAYKKYTGFSRYIIGFTFIVFIFLITLIWKQIGGFFETGANYDSPEISISLATFGLISYLKYMFAYFIMLCPIGLIGLIITISYLLRKKLMVLKENPSIILLMLCVVCIYPFPAFFLIKNAAYWDNLCKFNFFGVLSSWILVIFYLNNSLTLTIKKKLKTIILISLFTIACHESVILLARTISDDSQKYYQTNIENKRDLIDFVTNNIPVISNIVILNKDLHYYYTIDKNTNKPDVSLYEYLNNYFSDFVIIAQETGASIINFYDFNFLLDRNREYLLLQTLNKLHSGDALALKEYDIGYVMYMDKYEPSYIKEWIQIEAIRLLKENSKEGWKIYKVL